MRMDLTDPVPSFRRLRAFEAAARRRSLSAAAQALRLTQPALTHSIAQLEAELGARLFERGPEGAFLNDAGRILERRALRFFEQTRAALAAAGERAADDPALDQQTARLASAQVRALLAIWRAGTFRAAAQALGVAEPSLQRPARELERMLGAPLYRRTAAGLAVNEAGRELARRLALAIAEIRSASDEIGAAAQTRASLRIGVLPLAPRILIARATGAVAASAGAQRIEVMEAAYVDLARMLNDGAIDLVFGALRDPPPYADLVEEPLFEDPYVIVCRRDHPLTLTKASPADLAAFEWVHPTIGLPRRAVLDRAIQEWRLSAKVSFETNCLATITALLSASDRLSVLSRWHVRLDERLAALETPGVPHAPRRIGVTYRRNWLPTPFQHAMLDRLRREAQDAAVLSK